MKLFIAGDLVLTNSVERVIKNDDSYRNLTNLTSKCDFSIANLEAPLTSSDISIKKTGPNLKSPPENIQSLKKLYINCCTLANNHILDFGVQGLKDTLNILNNNEIKSVGAHKTSLKDIPLILEKDNIQVAVINFCENEWSTSSTFEYSANGFNEVDAYNQIQQAKSITSHVVVIYHGGSEHYGFPTIRLKKLFRFFVDSGASAVVCHHSHVISGWEVYKSAPIFYSLGNFIFDDNKSIGLNWNFGMSVILNLGQNITFDCYFFTQMNGEISFELLNSDGINIDIEKVNKQIMNDNFLEENFSKFINDNTKMYNSFLLPGKNRILNKLYNNNILPSPWHPYKRLLLKNLLHCEAHREAVLKLLENEISNS